MTRVNRLAGLAAVCLTMVLPATPILAQTNAPMELAQQGGQQGQMGQDQMRETMRDMMRQMMQQRMEQGGGEGEQPYMGERLRERAAEGDRGEWRDREGWRGHGHRHGPRWMKGVGLKILFAVMDTNGDGRLTLDEVNEFHARIFRAMDRNQQGYLTPQDIKDFFHGDGGDNDEE